MPGLHPASAAQTGQLTSPFPPLGDGIGNAFLTELLEGLLRACVSIRLHVVHDQYLVDFPLGRALLTTFGPGLSTYGWCSLEDALGMFG